MPTVKVQISIAATKARQAAEKETTLEGRIRAAMKATRQHWMATEEDDQFKAAVAAIYELSDEPTRSKILKEMEALRNINALISGVPVDLAALPEPDPEPIGLLNYWREVKRG